MAEFVGFSQEDAEAIRETRLVIEKYIPDIVGKFYTNLLSYPPTRRVFSKKDGSIDQDYLQLRMHHLTNFLRRTASGVYDEDYASFVDYVGRAHTTHGADPKIYIPERYVIGQVGLIQHAISEALHKELHEFYPELESRASRAWNLLMMVILEMLARAYSDERGIEGEAPDTAVDSGTVHQLAVQIYEKNVGMYRSIEIREVRVASAAEIPPGERKLVDVDGVSIGVFHHNDGWYALSNSCLHRGGPVCTGPLQGNVITCPWHGYQYNLTNGELLLDRSAKLEMYPVEVRDGEIFLRVPFRVMENAPVSLNQEPIMPESQAGAAEAELSSLKENEFRVSELQPGQIGLVIVDGEEVAVYNLEGALYATQNECTHAYGPLNEGEMEGTGVVCLWHDSCFDVRDGSVIRGPATEPLRTYRVVVEGDIARVE
jgi:nitrite reductase/ring-hydroxylating ferredoxin subunit/hemoglobin-like flavoprotein